MTTNLKLLHSTSTHCARSESSTYYKYTLATFRNNKSYQPRRELLDKIDPVWWKRKRLSGLNAILLPWRTLLRPTAPTSAYWLLGQILLSCIRADLDLIMICTDLILNEFKQIGFIGFLILERTDTHTHITDLHIVHQWPTYRTVQWPTYFRLTDNRYHDSILKTRSHLLTKTLNQPEQNDQIDPIPVPVLELIKSQNVSCCPINSVKTMVKVKIPIVSITLSELCDCRVGAHLCLHGLEPAVSCRHSSVMWAVGHTSPTYCHYLPI